MQKKIQIMLPIWLADFLEILSGKFELSISELARLQICFSLIVNTSFLYPEYKPEIPPKEMSSKIFKYLESEDREDFLRFLSEIYFEARKAVKYRLKVEGHESP